MQGFTVIAPGLLSLIQDSGRFGHQQIGLTNGGPMDPYAHTLANRLCGNPDGTSAIEVSVGGLTLEAHSDCHIALTGAKLPLSINQKTQEAWQTLEVKAGDKISIAFASESDSGCRAYLAVSGGFDVPLQFDSSATVCREGIGGLQGKALQKGDKLSIGQNQAADMQKLSVPTDKQSSYPKEVELRVITGYQKEHFSRVKQAIFFSSEYQVSSLCDRMGYRLEGPKVNADIDGILSEGICLGAIQVPADGQPIVLMNDRQTIGGYPKIGSVLGLDLAKLAQLGSGGRIRFREINIDQAQQAQLLAQRQLDQLTLEPL